MEVLSDRRFRRAAWLTHSFSFPSTAPLQEKAVKGDVHLASISGGTDILGCFALGNPTLPVRAGHVQCLGLGMDVCAYRGDGDGAENSAVAAAESRVAPTGEMGELVCRCAAGCSAFWQG